MMPPEDQHRNDHRVDDFFQHRPSKQLPPVDRWEPLVSAVLHMLIAVSIGFTFGGYVRGDRNWVVTVCTIVTCLWGCYALFAVMVVAAYDAAERRKHL